MRLSLFAMLAVALVALAATHVEAVEAEARHILVKEYNEALSLKERIDHGEDFSELARQHSTCPSGKRGGSLGTFRPGQMVTEFNDVVFNDEVGVVHGPVKTRFGYHLILTDRRE